MRRSRTRALKQLPPLRYVVLGIDKHWLTCMLADGRQMTGRDVRDLEKRYEGCVPPGVLTMREADPATIAEAGAAPELLPQPLGYRQAGATMVLRDGRLVPKS